MCGQEPAWLTGRLASSSSQPVFFYPVTCSTSKKQSMKWQEWLHFGSNAVCFYRSPECRSLSTLLCLLPSAARWSLLLDWEPWGLLGFQHVQWSSGRALVRLGKAIRRHLHTACPEGQGLQIQCCSHTICPVGGFLFQVVLLNVCFLAWYNEYCTV